MKNYWLSKKTSLPKSLSMGLGQLGNPEVRFIRKWRYMVEFLEDSEVIVDPCFVKIGQRPGPFGLGELSLTYYDAPLSVMNLLAKVYDKKPDNISAKMRLYDGCGNALEQWHMTGIQFISANFGDLDFSSSEECILEVNLSYKNSSWMSLTSEFSWDI